MEISVLHVPQFCRNFFLILLRLLLIISIMITTGHIHTIRLLGFVLTSHLVLLNHLASVPGGRISGGILYH